MNELLGILHQVITSGDRRLLEVNSGDGSFASSLAPHFPQVEWYPTEGSAQLHKLSERVSVAGVRNLLKPTRIEIGKDELPKLKFDLVFTANAFHLKQWKECKSLIKQFGGRLREGSRVIIYGPFKYNGAFQSAETENLDKELKAKDPLIGLRNFEDVNNTMIKNGFELLMDTPLSEGNHVLVYNRLKFIPKR